MAKISKKLRIKWNFELTVFELTVPDLYHELCLSMSESGIRYAKIQIQTVHPAFLKTFCSHVMEVSFVTV